MNRVKRIAAAITLLSLAACSPSLNWRQVPVAQLSALLPCKPDHAERQVELMGEQRPLAMWGCEAGKALYAVSYMPVPVGTSPDALMLSWETAALRNARAAQPKEIAFEPPRPRHGDPARGRMIGANGQQADGQNVQLQLAWFSAGGVVYHLAVYGPSLTAAQMQPFFTEVHWL